MMILCEILLLYSHVIAKKNKKFKKEIKVGLQKILSKKKCKNFLKKKYKHIRKRLESIFY